MNKEIQEFIEKTGIKDFEKMESVKALREIVLKTYPETHEKIMYGGIMFFLNGEGYSGLFVSKNHISIEFSNGFKMNDPKNHLEGNGKYRRHLKIKSFDDIKNKEAEFYIKQAVE